MRASEEHNALLEPETLSTDNAAFGWLAGWGDSHGNMCVLLLLLLLLLLLPFSRRSAQVRFQENDDERANRAITVQLSRSFVVVMALPHSLRAV